MTDTRWNGEPCDARRITAVVADTDMFASYWARQFVGTRRDVVEVEYGGRTFYIDDEDGSGWHKVTQGGGSPRCGSKSIAIDPDSIQPRGNGSVNPDQPCPHDDFEAYISVAKVTASETDTTAVGYHADIKVNCADCGEQFRWTGVPAGSSPGQPMCSVDETELRAPLRPASSDPDFGLGLPGFAVNYRAPKED